MTPLDLRIAMAELDGYKYRPAKTDGIGEGYWCSNNTGPWKLNELPDYPFDLNAVHKLEKKLTQEQQIIYFRILWLVVNGSLVPFGNPQYIIHAVFATALQRCEALARLHGKWKD